MIQDTIITRRKFLQNCGLETTVLMLPHRSGEFLLFFNHPLEEISKNWRFWS